MEFRTALTHKIFFIIVIITTPVCLWLLTQPRPRLVMLDVGQGLSVFWEDQTGFQLLYDGGPGQAVLAELGAIMSPYDRTIDLVILSHTHSDHLEGLIEVLKRYQVKELWWSQPGGKGDAYQEFIQVLKESGTKEQVVAAGWQRQLASGYNLKTYYPLEPLNGQLPEHAHDASLIISINWQNQSLILLTGDLEAKNENEFTDHCQKSVIVPCLFPVKILQVSHHGSRNTSSTKFLKLAKPITAWIGVGTDNKFGHPHQETIERLQNLNIEIKRTDLEGRITQNLTNR